MNCKDCLNELLNDQFEPAAASSGVQEHLAGCENCSAEINDLRATMALLDAWKAPEPSQYFDQKLAVLLREEQEKEPAGWLERLRERLLWNTGRQFRPALVGAMALLIMLGGGSYIGVSTLNHPAEVQASATVNDLQILDKNAQAIQQMDQLLQDDDTNDSGASTSD